MIAAEPTRASRSSQQIQALRHRDAILPEPPLSPLVPQESSPSNETLIEFYHWAAFSEEALEARAAKRLMEALR